MDEDQPAYRYAPGEKPLGSKALRKAGFWDLLFGVFFTSITIISFRIVHSRHKSLESFQILSLCTMLFVSLTYIYRGIQALRQSNRPDHSASE